MVTVLLRLRSVLRNLEEVFISAVFGGKYPRGEYVLASAGTCLPKQSTNVSPLESLLGNGFLWAVPKNRRTIEKRWKRKFGKKDGFWKMIDPKNHLLTCNTCGHFYEAGNICPNCYNRIWKETQEMQTRIQKDLGLAPVEQEVVVLYQGEKQEKPDEFWKGKRIVEIERERPHWFSKNLLQRSTTEPSPTGDVKPKELA